MPVIPGLETLIRARQQYAHGEQREWFDHPNCIAFARSGTEELPGCVVIMSNGEAGEKTLELGENYAGKRWHDLLEQIAEPVNTDDQGNAVFRCAAGSVSVWVIS